MEIRSRSANTNTKESLVCWQAKIHHSIDSFQTESNVTKVSESKQSPIPQRLKEARLKAKLSQKALGIKTGMDQFVASARINHYERGKHTPDFLTVKRLAKALNVPVPLFYTEDDTLASLILALNKMPKKKLNNILKFITESC